MSHLVMLNRGVRGATDAAADFLGYVRPFAARLRARPFAAIPMVALKAIEYSVYRFHRPAAPPPPYVSARQLIYKITSRCTERCPKCGIWAEPERPSDRIPSALVVRAVRDLRPLLECVTITGGEPLVYAAEVLEIAEAAGRAGADVVVVTAASVMRPDFLARYARTGGMLVISADTADPARWAEFRGRANFDRVMGSTRDAVRVLGADRVRIQSVLARESEYDVAGVRALADALGVRHQVQPCMDFGGTWQPVQVTVRNGARSRQTPAPDDSPCHAWQNVSLYPNGDVVRCFDHRQLDYATEPLGNLRSAGVRDILASARAADVTRRMRDCRLPCKQLNCNIDPWSLA